LTEDGRDLLDHARHLIEIADGLEGSLQRHSTKPSGHVRLGCSIDGGLWLASRLPKLTARYPDLSIELVMRDSFGDMVEDRLDIALINGEMSDGTLIGRQIGELTNILVAAPAYLERHGAPSVPSDLAAHRCLVQRNGTPSVEWHFVGPSGRESVSVAGQLSANNRYAVHRAAVAGGGIAVLPNAFVVDDIRTGRLVELLPEYQAESQPLRVVYPSRRHLAPRTRVVIDFLVDEIRASLAMLAAAMDQMHANNAWLV
jgi:DNA-binding transcriptional LysR family regulator